MLSGAAEGFEISGALARQKAGQDLGEALGLSSSSITISASLDEALGDAEVLIDFTHPSVVKGNVLAALSRGVSVVVGTSGLGAEDFHEIESEALARGRGVIAAGNFSLTAALAKRFALLASDHIPHWELIDYAHGSKVDAPSGTVRELAESLGERNANQLIRPIDEVLGPREARGAQIGGTPVHSLRLPSYVVSFEALFGLPHERLTIRHDAGSGAEPYVGGALLAARRAAEVKGLIRGLDTLLFDAG